MLLLLRSAKELSESQIKLLGACLQLEEIRTVERNRFCRTRKRLYVLCVGVGDFVLKKGVQIFFCYES